MVNRRNDGLQFCLNLTLQQRQRDLFSSFIAFFSELIDLNEILFCFSITPYILCMPTDKKALSLEPNDPNSLDIPWPCCREFDWYATFFSSQIWKKLKIHTNLLVLWALNQLNFPLVYHLINLNKLLPFFLTILAIQVLTKTILKSVFLFPLISLAAQTTYNIDKW